MNVSQTHNPAPSASASGTIGHSGRPNLFRFTSLALVPLSLGGIAFAGPDWDQDLQTDANQTAATAQVITAPPSPILSITGRLNGYGVAGGDFVDMYQFELGSDLLLSISTAGGNLGGYANFDSQLFLFRKKGGNGSNPRASALKGNDNAWAGARGSRIGEIESIASNAVFLKKGVYYIAITGFGSAAYADDGSFIWPQLGTPGATMNGNDRLLNNWTGQGAVGEYMIRIQSLSGAAIPAPGALALLGLGALATHRRRR